MSYQYALVEDPTVTVKYRTSIKMLFFYSNLCLSVMSASLICSFTTKSFLTNYDLPRENYIMKRYLVC